MTSDRRRALIAKFRQSAREQVDLLDRAFVELEKRRDDAALAGDVLRTVHTLKGDAKIVGFASVNQVAHRTEDVLLWAKGRGFDVPPEAADLIFQGFDLLRHLIAAEANDETRLPDIERFVGRAGELLASLPAPAPGAALAAPKPEAPAAPARPAVDESEAVRVPTRRLSTLTSLAGTLLVRQEQLEAAVGGLEAQRRRLERALVGATDDDEPEALLRGLGQGLAALRSEAFECRMQLLTLQEEVRQMRLRQIGDLFERYPRAVRDLARDQEKRIRVEISGSDVTVDKQVLDELDKVLLHLVRNAVDHGVEPPAARLQAGKPEEAALRLGARPVGGQIEVEVSDDGRGIDPSIIREVAVRRGVLDAAEAEALDDEALRRLVFQPGFSTREEATDVSGRGIGLDVVRQQVERLGGSVRLTSEPGKGTAFTLRLPVSLSLTQVLLVEAGGRTFALPALAVGAALRLRPEAAERSGEGRAIRVAGVPLPLVDLATLLGLPAGHATDADLDVAVVESGAYRVAVRVGRFRGQRAVVATALDRFLANVRVVSGTAEIEGGRRVLLLSVAELIGLAGRGMIGAGAEEAIRRKRILVVDDSPIIREIMGPLLARLGYEVLEAVDGREGFARACEAEPDLVMTDLEMPVLDGLGLIRKIRESDRLKHLPVVVLSTRGADEDKRRAMEAGANAYLVKTHFDEGEMSRTLRSLLG